MCHSRTNNRKIYRLQERHLHIVQNDKKISFQQLLEKDSSVSVHSRNLQLLATKIMKIFKSFQFSYRMIPSKKMTIPIV